MKKITACIMLLLTIAFLPLAVSAQKTTLTTTVPVSHILHIEIVGKGTVTVDGVAYSQTADVQFLRNSQPTVSMKPSNGVCVTFNDEDITEQIRNGNWTMPPITDDALLTVVFKEAATTPATGDTTNIPLLFAVAFLSLTGLAFCLRNQKNNIW